METVLQQLNAVPGVVGTLLCTRDGSLLARAFPPVFDAAALMEAAKAIAESGAGLESVTGPVQLLDLRYGNARIVVRPLSGANLVCLCAPTMNLQPLTISASVAASKLEKLVAARGGAAGAAPSAPSAGGELWTTLQRINAVIERKGLDAFKARGAIAIKAGFGLGFIDPETPDDAQKITKLKEAAAAVLGELF